MNEKTHSSKIGRMLKKRYILALGIIACLVVISQVIIQVAIISQQDDSRVINLAGKQRMLSQRINKAAFGLYISSQGADQKRYLEELEFSLNLWTRTHAGLQNGDEELGLPGKNSQRVKEMFGEIEPQYDIIVRAAANIQKLASAEVTDKMALLAQIQRIQDNETGFLKGMDAIVFQYDAESKEKIELIKTIEIVILLVTFFTLTMEIMYIFRPAQRQIETSINLLEETKDTMEKIFETAPTAMLLVDEMDFGITKLNHLAKETLKIQNLEFDPVNFKEMLIASNDQNKDLLQLVFSGVPVENMELLLTTKDKDNLVMLLSSNIIKYEEHNTIVVGLSDITLLKGAEEVLKRYATTDEMTGLLNKRSGLLVLDNVFNRAKTENTDLSICFMDLDGLKLVNDTYGHMEGDFYIKTVAEVIKANLNFQDSVFRYGGDEIVIILDKCNREMAEKVNMRIKDSLKEASVRAGKPYLMHVSTGLGVLSEEKVETSDQLLSVADRIMYDNKRVYKQKCVV